MFGPTSRREWLWNIGGGLGGIALARPARPSARLLAGPDRPRADFDGGLHHRAKARRVFQIFLNGGMSQMDTFDHKPELDRRHGEPFDPGEHVEGSPAHRGG